jgi:hypothetical protein
VPHDTRDEVVDFRARQRPTLVRRLGPPGVNRWSGKTGLPNVRFVSWLEIERSKFSSWKSRYGKANEHNSWIPRDHWLEDWPKVRLDCGSAGPDGPGRRRRSSTTTPRIR